MIVKATKFNQADLILKNFTKELKKKNYWLKKSAIILIIVKRLMK